MNRIILLGNITTDPIFKNEGKAPFFKFIIGVDRDKDRSDYFKCVAFNRQAEYLNKYAAKGSKVALEGRLSSDKYVDKNGSTQYSIEVIIDRINILSRATERLDEVSEELKSTGKIIDAYDDGLPF